METKVMTKHEVEAAINPMVGLVKRFFGEKDKVTGRDALLVAAQAEIAFKAGEEKGEKAGIRKVVEWINGHTHKLAGEYFMAEWEWQAQLKDWGLEDKDD